LISDTGARRRTYDWEMVEQFMERPEFFKTKIAEY